jgi:hypothetical protein
LTKIKKLYEQFLSVNARCAVDDDDPAHDAERGRLFEQRYQIIQAIGVERSENAADISRMALVAHTLAQEAVGLIADDGELVILLAAIARDAAIFAQEYGALEDECRKNAHARADATALQ